MKEIEIRVDDGADKDKLFVVRRMSAFTADRWARHTVRALARAGARTPKEALEVGITGLAGQSMAIFGHMSDEDCDKAFDGLDACLYRKRDPGNPNVEPTPLAEIDVSDPNTMPRLRAEAFKLNVDFFKAAIYQIYPLIEALRDRVVESGPNQSAA